jgi:hypothetical protein
LKVGEGVAERAKWIKRLSRRRLRIPPGGEIPEKGKDPRAARRLGKEETRRALHDPDEVEDGGKESVENEANPG